MNRLERYNPNKRGSFKIIMEFYDWELAVMIRAIREYKQKWTERKAYSTWLENLEQKLSKALGKTLKAELRDLKLEKIPELSQFLRVS